MNILVFVFVGDIIFYSFSHTNRNTKKNRSLKTEQLFQLAHPCNDCFVLFAVLIHGTVHFKCLCTVWFMFVPGSFFKCSVLLRLQTCLFLNIVELT